MGAVDQGWKRQALYRQHYIPSCMGQSTHIPPTHLDLLEVHRGGRVPQELEQAVLAPGGGAGLRVHEDAVREALGDSGGCGVGVVFPGDGLFIVLALQGCGVSWRGNGTSFLVKTCKVHYSLHLGHWNSAASTKGRTAEQRATVPFTETKRPTIPLLSPDMGVRGSRLVKRTRRQGRSLLKEYKRVRLGES